MPSHGQTSASRPAPAALLLIAAGLLAALAAGCSSNKLRFNAEETYGKVYYLDGIGCAGFGREAVPAGLRQAGYRGDVEYWMWSSTRTPLDQLGWVGQLIRLKGKDLARLITLYRQTYPGRPVCLVGLSAGTGVAVWACEELPPGVYVDEVVLVASSLSDGYDLSKALRHVRGNITLYQTQDDAALGIGARIMGTIDGVPMGTSAGLVGFRAPSRQSDEQRDLYLRVRNVPYSPMFAALGFDGSHTSAVDSPAFVRQQIAPLVMAHDCDPGTEGQPAGAEGDPIPLVHRPGQAPAGEPVASTQPEQLGPGVETQDD